jgi:hypothetical protein
MRRCRWVIALKAGIKSESSARVRNCSRSSNLDSMVGQREGDHALVVLEPAESRLGNPRRRRADVAEPATEWRPTGSETRRFAHERSRTIDGD